MKVHFFVQKSLKPSLRLLLFSISSLAALSLAWLIPAIKGIYCIRHYGYVFLLLSSALFVGAVYKLYRERSEALSIKKKLRKKRFWLILIALGLSSYFVSVQGESGYTILFDEACQAATALGLHLKREVYMPLRAHTLSGTYCLLDGSVDKRPPLFSFLVSLVHDLTGFRFGNIFWINSILTPIFLILSFLIGRELCGWRAGLGLLFLLISFPLLISVAQGAGFELLFLTLITTCLYFSILHLKRPTNSSFWALCLACVLLSQTRYEAGLFIAASICIIVVSWLKERTVMIPYWAFALPFFFVPAVWHHRFFELIPSAWEMSSKPEASSPFSIAYIPQNIGHAFSFFLGKTPFLPNSIFLSIGGIFCFFGLLVYAIRRFRNWRNWSEAFLAMLIFEIGFFSLFLLLLSYFWGQLDDIVIMRLALPLGLGMGLSLIFFCFNKQAPRFMRSVFWVFACANFFLWSLPRMHETPWKDMNALLKDAQTIEAFAQDHAQESYLMLSAAPVLWIPHQVDVVSLKKITEKKQALQHYLNRPSHPPIYVQEWIHHSVQGEPCYLESTQTPSSIRQDPDFIIEEVESHYSNNTMALVISRLIKIENVEVLNEKKAESQAERYQQICRNLP